MSSSPSSDRLCCSSRHSCSRCTLWWQSSHREDRAQSRQGSLQYHPWQSEIFPLKEVRGPIIIITSSKVNRKFLRCEAQSLISVYIAHVVNERNPPHHIEDVWRPQIAADHLQSSQGLVHGRRNQALHQGLLGENPTFFISIIKFPQFLL